jgi:hypothetical protein
MHDGYEPVSCQKCGKLLVSDAFFGEAGQKRRGDQHKPDSRIRQALVNGPHHRNSESKVLFAEPYFDTSGYEQLMQFFSCPLPVIPSVAEKYITQVRLLRCPGLNCLTDWCK